jgi:type I restriction enzyme S subunit
MLTKYKLRELIDVTRGMSLPGEYYSETGEYIRLTMGNFNYNGGGFKENTSKSDIYYTGPVREEFILNKGDIITPLTEQAIGLLGTTAMIPESGKYIQSQDVALISCKQDKIDHLFCYYLISSDIVKKQLSAAAQQTKIRHTSPDKIMDCSVWIPEMKLQQKIGKTLYEIDQKIALNTRMNAELEAMAKQLYDYWFVQFDFPDENGKPYKSSGGKMVYNPTLKREIPAGWEDSILSDIANITMGQSPDGSSYNDVGKGTIFYQGSTDFGIRFPSVRMYTTSPGRFAKKGDILMSVRAPVGDTNIANIDCCIGRGLAALNSKIGSITHLYFILRDLKAKFDKLNAVGTTFGAITKDELFSLPIVKPTDNILNQYEEICSPIFDKQLIIGSEIERLTHLRDSLLPMLMNGQVTVE